MMTLACAGIRSSYHGMRTMRCWMARAAGRLYVLIFAPNQSGAESAWGVRRDKAALSSGCKPHPATAPAGSNRSSHGGNEVAEAFD